MTESLRPIEIARNVLRNCEVRNPQGEEVALQIGILAALIGIYEQNIPPDKATIYD